MPHLLVLIFPATSNSVLKGSDKALGGNAITLVHKHTYDYINFVLVVVVHRRSTTTTDGQISVQNNPFNLFCEPLDWELLITQTISCDTNLALFLHKIEIINTIPYS